MVSIGYRSNQSAPSFAYHQNQTKHPQFLLKLTLPAAIEHVSHSQQLNSLSLLEQGTNSKLIDQFISISIFIDSSLTLLNEPISQKMIDCIHSQLKYHVCWNFLSLLIGLIIKGVNVNPDLAKVSDRMLIARKVLLDQIN